MTIIVVNSHGFVGIGGLSRSVGCDGFGTSYRFRDLATGPMNGKPIPIDFAADAASYDVHAI